MIHFKRICYVLIPIVFVFLTSCETMTSNIEPTSPIAQVKEVPSLKFPYSVWVKFDENKVVNYEGFQIKVGKYLQKAINNYLYPAFDQSSRSSITLYINSYINPKTLSGFPQGKITVNVDLVTTLFLDYIPIYTMTTKGYSEAPYFYPKLPERIDTIMENATTEAVKGIPGEVVQVFSNPEKAILKTEEQINWILKNFGVNDPLMKPGLIRSYIELANLLRLIKRQEEAISVAKRVLDLDPNNSMAYAVLGLIYQEQKKYKEAEENFKKAIALDPKAFSHYIKLARLYYEKEAYVQAANTLIKTLEIAPTSKEAYGLLLTSYMAMGEFDKAIETATKAIKAYSIIGIGVKIGLQGEYPIVEQVLEGEPAKIAGVEVGDKIIKINKQPTTGLKIDDVIKLISGEEGTQVTLTIKRGNEEFEKTITRKPIVYKEASLFFALRSLSYREKGNIEQAMKDAEWAYALNPNLDEAKEALGAIYLDGAKYDEAIKILSSTSEEDKFAKVLLAIAYAKTNKFNEALDIYNRIPEDYWLTKSVFKNKTIDNLSISLKPYKNILIQNARNFELKGQYKEAIREYANFLKIADENEAKQIRSHIAGLIMKYPHLFALSEEARKAIIRAEIYTQEGKFEKAIEEYKNALKISPFFPALYKALALNYGGLKDYRNAIKNMKIYLELLPDAPDLREAKDQIYRWEFMMEKGE